MFNLDATEEQLDFATIYGSSKNGWMGADWKTPTEDITYLMDKILEHIPAPKENTDDYVYKGMAQRAFTRKLQLSEYVEAKGAELEDGILKIKLEYCPPEDKRPKKISIK